MSRARAAAIVAVLFLIAAYLQLWTTAAGLVLGWGAGAAERWITARLDRRRPARLCRRKGHIWVHSGGRNAGCDLGRDCGCSVPVMLCARCHDCDYGENEEARQTIERCAQERIDA